MSRVILSPRHGVNPSVECCFYCGKDRGVALLGRLPGDQEAPRRIVIDREPCDECKGYMEKGVILISVDEKLSDDKTNPWRTGGWCVVKDDFIERVVSDGALKDSILKKRVAFLPDDAWDHLGLPRGEKAKEV